MAFRYTTLGTLDDQAALAELREAFELVGGNVVRAAHALGISRRQLYRYLEKVPGGWGVADAARQRAWDEFAAARARLGVRLPNA